MAINETKLKEFLEKGINDVGATLGAALVVVGDKLGLYKAMAGAGPLTPGELARKTGTAERYIYEWLNNQAAGGYVTYDAATAKYTLPPEQARALADEESDCLLTGNFQAAADIWAAIPKMLANFRSGNGMDWGEHTPDLFEGTERCFKPNYIGNLVKRWIPALDGVEAKLQAGATVADVGCGHGVSTIVMAQAYPRSQFIGFDYHAPSIEVARQRAQVAGLADRLRFEVGNASNFPGKGYALVANFDCLHDMGDPLGAARHVLETLDKDGTWMIVEPFAHDKVEDNLNPIGRIFYGASTMVCVPASLAHHGPALGAQAGEGRLKAIVMKAGFTRFRRATETRFNLVLEARP
ncbi:MAG: class I SAM-dependent methyltransferase [Gemmataceae bacterium]|nr:class I SAM-dependent methyltransferase [Gemmataceae bacterium]